jgi:hypothetical protein
MLVHKRGAWLIPYVTFPSLITNLIYEDVFTGYGDHEWRLEQIKSHHLSMYSDIAYRIGVIAKGLIASGDVREVRIIGHADRVWSHGTEVTADELHTSQQRADDVWDHLHAAINSLPGGPPISMKLMADEIGLIVGGVGARVHIYKNGPENRRVQVQLWKTRSIPV